MGAELVTGTFYLLAIGIASPSAASPPGSGSSGNPVRRCRGARRGADDRRPSLAHCAGCRRRRRRRSTSASRCACASGTPTAPRASSYRGTHWDAELAARPPRRGVHVSSSTCAARARAVRPPPCTRVNRLEAAPCGRIARCSSSLFVVASSSSSARLARGPAAARVRRRAPRPLPRGAAARASTSSCRSSTASPTRTTSARSRWTCRRRSASPRTTRSCRSTASCISRSPTPSSRPTARPTIVLAITQLAQTTLRSVIGRMELDSTFEERDHINAHVVAALDEAARELGRQGAALRDQGPDAAEGDPARDAGADHRRAREARGDRDVRRAAAGADQHRRPAHARPRSRNPKARSRREINNAQGEAAAILAIARSERARRSGRSAEAISAPGGIDAVNLQGRRAIRRGVRQSRQARATR